MKKEIQKAEIVEKKQKKQGNFKISLTYDPHRKKIEFKAPSVLENTFQVFLTKIATKVADRIIEKIEERIFKKR